MAVEAILNYQNAGRILSESFENDARPIVILEASSEERSRLVSELFSYVSNLTLISFSDFMMKYIYSIKNQQTLLEYDYVVIDCVENVRGMSGTLKILSKFIDTMVSHNVSVIFMGSSIYYDLSEVRHIIGSKIQYIIKIDDERNN